MEVALSELFTTSAEYTRMMDSVGIPKPSPTLS